MWRVGLLIGVLICCAMFVERVGLLAKDKAFLIAGVMASVVVFVIPGSERRERAGISSLICWLFLQFTAPF